MPVRQLLPLLLLGALACRQSAPADAGTADAMAGPVDIGVDGGPCLSGTQDSPLNGECSCPLDCVPGTLCEAEDGAGGPRGTCARLCTVSADECGDDGNSCQRVPELPGDQGVCRADCVSDTDCREGWACFYGACVGFCTSDDQCLSDACDPDWQQCRPTPYPDGGGIGDRCTRPEDCRSTICLTAIGACIGACKPGLGGCPDSATCVTGVDPDDLDVGVCMLTCATTDDCPGDLECLGTGDGRTACWSRG